MPLTDTAIRSAKPREMTFKLFDSGGLYLEVNPSGGRCTIQGLLNKLALRYAATRDRDLIFVMQTRENAIGWEPLNSNRRAYIRRPLRQDEANALPSDQQYGLPHHSFRSSNFRQ